MKTNHIVYTTIFDSPLLSSLENNIVKYGHVDSTKIWVIGDRKTPTVYKERCARMYEMSEIEAVYIDVDDQNEWGQRVPEFYSRIPFNNETRRNIGYLMAYEDGCERLISMDDDNFPTDEHDFIGGHEKTGSRISQDVISEPSGFYNLCELLTLKPPRHIYPRGFPFSLRAELITNKSNMLPHPPGAKIGANAGMWIVEPDIDATTWINGRVISEAYNGPSSVVLSQTTWSPVNTQNTSVCRSLIPAYLCIPMGFPVPGGKIERYGDIWGGYFLQAICRGTPWHISFGQPVVEHRRNPHNYVDDLRHEFWGLILTDWLLNHLVDNFKPASSSIPARTAELAEFIRVITHSSAPSWCPQEVKAFLISTAETLDLWQGACQSLAKNYSSQSTEEFT